MYRKDQHALVTGKNVLDQLAELADFTGDYEQLY